MCVCIYTYVCMYVSMYVCVYIYTYICTCSNDNLKVLMSPFPHTYIRYSHTYIHSYIHTYIHAHTHTGPSGGRHIASALKINTSWLILDLSHDINIYTYIHTYIHTCTHTHRAIRGPPHRICAENKHIVTRSGSESQHSRIIGNVVHRHVTEFQYYIATARCAQQLWWRWVCAFFCWGY